MNLLLREEAKGIKEPNKIGSYKEDDCIFLLKNINGLIKEDTNKNREKAILRGTHYSEMLPIEYAPSKEYIDLFHSSLRLYAERIAKQIAYVSELIIEDRGSNLVLVSLARGGTPIGVLIKRYLKNKGIDLPHYSISIIRDKGLDINALKYIVNKHKGSDIQFIDGWTGKGIIGKELDKSIEKFNENYNTSISSSLAVLSDPSKSVEVYGTREDYLIPSACLNSTVSGLVSRTVRSKELIERNEFDGVKYYEHLKENDLTSVFVDTVSMHFKERLDKNIECKVEKGKVLNTGLKEVKSIQEEFNIGDINKIKPGVGETTRVLLRRVPDKILVKNMDNPNIKHILLLAKEKDIDIVIYENMSYACMGLIIEETSEL